MKKAIPNDIATMFFMQNIEGAVQGSGSLQGRCPVCGDSQKHTHKKRLYLLYDGDRGWSVFCHNCNLSVSLFNFVKEYFPEHFSTFRRNCFSTYVDTLKKEKKDTEEEREKRLLEKLKNKNRTKRISKSKVQQFYDNECEELSEELKEEVRKRNIPSNVLDSLKYCNSTEKKYRKYKGRLIIPFFNDNGEIYYFQGRALTDEQSPKYINWDGLDNKPEFNEYGVNYDDTIYIVEGLFDSTFIDNAVSILGVKLSNDKIKYLEDKYSKQVYCLDNDKDGIFWTKYLLKKNKTCLIFPKEYKKCKDINDIANLVGTNNLTEFVKKNSHKGAKGLVKLQQLIRS